MWFQSQYWLIIVINSSSVLALSNCLAHSHPDTPLVWFSAVSCVWNGLQIPAMAKKGQWKKGPTMGKPISIPRQCVMEPIQVPKLNVNDRILQFQIRWLMEIMHNNKRAEIRGSSARPGPLWLGSKGVIYAHAEISSIQEVKSIDELNSFEEKTHYKDTELPYKRTYIWHLDKVQCMIPVKYLIKSGAVVWAKFRPCSWS